MSNSYTKFVILLIITLLLLSWASQVDCLVWPYLSPARELETDTLPTNVPYLLHTCITQLAVECRQVSSVHDESGELFAMNSVQRNTGIHITLYMHAYIYKYTCTPPPSTHTSHIANGQDPYINTFLIWSFKPGQDTMQTRPRLAGRIVVGHS